MLCVEIPKSLFPNGRARLRTCAADRKLSQEGFGGRVGVSAMAVSRWERGVSEPTGETYIRLGNLADAPLCWFFWKRAGLRLSDITRVLPEARQRVSSDTVFDAQFVSAGSKKKISPEKADLVVIPFLAVHAGTPGVQGDHHDLTDISAGIRVGCAARLVPQSRVHRLSSREGRFHVSPGP